MSELTFSPDGHTLYASDGPRGAVLRFRVDGTTLVADGSIDLAGKKGSDPWPAGLAVTPDDGHLLVAANLGDALLIADPVHGKILATVPVGHLPYAVALDRSGGTAFVSNWGTDTVSVVDIASAKVVDTVRVGASERDRGEPHRRGDLRRERRLGHRERPGRDHARGPAYARPAAVPWRASGASPVSLSVSPDGSTLYVANAGDNDIAVVALAPPGRPTAIACSA